MPNLTSNYDFNLPLVNDATDQDLWGGYLNANWTSIDSLLYTASNWVKRSVSTTDTATTADRKKLLLCDATSASFVQTLPVAATAGDGFAIAVKKVDATANTVTVEGAGADTVDGDSSIVLSVENDCVQLVSDGVSNWNSIARDPVILPEASTTTQGIIEIATDAEFFAASETDKALVPSNFVNDMATSGYTRVGPLIIQWGQNTIATSQSVSFPIAFPNACLQVMVTPANAGTTTSPASGSYTTTSFIINNGGTSTVTQRWLAVGY